MRNSIRAQFSQHTLLILSIMAVSPCAIGQTAPPRPTTRPSPLVQQFLRKHGAGWTVRLSADEKRIESVVGLGTQASEGKPEEIARRFLRENAALFGLRPDLGDLRVYSQHTNTGGATVEFQQIVDGLPVENGHVRLNLTKDGRILHVVSSYAPFGPQAAAVRITRQQAVETALQALLESANRVSPGKPRREGAPPKPPIDRASLKLEGEPKVEEVYFVVDGALRRAYKIQLRATVPLSVKDFLVDAETGRVLRVRDFIAYVDATGQVFLPNPVNSMNSNSLTDANYATTAGTSNNPNPYYTRQLLDLDPPVAGKYKLTGPFVTLEEIEDPKHDPPSESTASFVYQRGNANFDDVMCYYHIDRMQRYIQLLGFIDINNRRVRVDSDGVPTTDPGCGTPDANGECDQSHYVPDGSGTGYIAYGHGGVDDAEDAEIIAHEYGHSIQDNSNVGAYAKSSTNDMPAAMGEGFGDYWAVSIYSAETTANGHTLPCVGEWDATSYSSTTPPCLRRVDGTSTMTAYVTGGDEHVNGQIWSATLFDLFNSLGKTTTDRLVLQSHFNVPSTGPKFKDAADAMLTADLQLFFGSHIPTLCSEFLTRKIYSAGDCPTLPSATGAQSTVVVLARFNDSGLPSSPLTAAQVGTKVNDMSAYLSEVSFTQASLSTPSIKGWLDLGKSRAHYYDETNGNMLIELVKDVIDGVHATDATFDFSKVDRLFIITNDDMSGGETRGDREWATTGPWPYAIPSGTGTKRFSASVHRFGHSAGRFDHALGHHFGMFDLYAHEGVTFPRPYADGWSNMAKDPSGNFNNVHFFGWDKLKAGWVSGGNIQFIARPPADPDPAHKFEQTFAIFREESNASNPILFQIGTTPGATQTTERVSYYVEARKKAGTFDANIPADAVLVYYVNEDIGQGFGPLRLVDATPGTSTDLTDAGLLPAPKTSTATDIDSTGLTVEVLPKVGTEDYRVHITYDPPETQNDVWIHPHDGNWKSPDIWVDSPACNAGICGFDKDNGRTEVDRGDKPQPTKVNRLYARIFNHGPATAHNVRVDFYLSEPYHAIDGGDVDPDTGGDAAFNKHFFTVITDLPKTDDGVPVFVEWTPDTPPSGQVHTCVKVKIASVFNDTNAANQASQENIDEYDLTSHSPYPQVVDDFKVVNPYDHSILTYLRADGVPVGWTVDIVPTKAYLPVGGSVNARMTIQAPLTYPICSTEFIQASAWYAAGDTLVPLGASVAQVNLKKSTDLTVKTTYQSCGRAVLGAQAVSSVGTGGACQMLQTKGCTVPPRPFEHITLTYTGPDGNPIYHDVVTDKDGCFEDFLVNPQGGIWSVETQYPGDVCTARTDGPKQTVVVIPPGQLPGTVPPGLRGRLWYSFHLGMNFPSGSFADSFEPGPSLFVDAEYQLLDRVSLELMYGFHFFHNKSVSSSANGLLADNLSYRNLSADVRAYLPFQWAKLYLQAGAGAYFPNSGSTAVGFNVGLGLSFPILTNLKAEVGSDLHDVDPGGLHRLFFDHHLGLAFRF